MGEQFNIKDAETIRLARKMAEQLGKSVSATIREALEEKAERRAAEVGKKIARINAAVAEFQRNMPPEWKTKTSKEIMDEIYDEDGLPI